MVLLVAIMLAACFVVDGAHAKATGSREDAIQECLGVYFETYANCAGVPGCNQLAWDAFDGCMILKGYPVNN